MPTQAKADRNTLTRDTVVEAALVTADGEGLKAVSFRRLAADLGVTPMALYRYVSSKEELLAAMMDRVFGEFELPAETQGDWREQLRELGRSFRRLLVAHPAAASLYLARVEAIFVNGLRVVEVILRVLQRAGFSRQQAALLEGTLERNVLALVLLETGSAAAATPEEQAARVRAQRARLLTLSPQEFPHVIAAADELTGAVDPDEAFEYALDLVIAGLEKQLDASQQSSHH